MNWLGRSYKNKLYAAMILVWFIPIVCFIAFDYYAVYTSNAEEIGRYTQSNLHIATQLIDNDISAFVGIVNTIATSEEVADILMRDENTSRKDFAETQQLYRVTQIAMAGLPERVPVHIVNLQRSSRYSTTNYFLPLYIDERGDLFEKMEAQAYSGRTAAQVHWRVDGAQAQDISYVLGRGILHPESYELVGYVVLDIYSSYFESIFDMVATQSGFNTLILDQSYTVISDAENQHYPGYAFPLGSAAFPSESWGSFEATVGEEAYLIYFDTSEHSHLKIIEMIPKDYLAMQALHDIRGHVMFFVLIFILGLVVIIALTERMMKPIKRLEHAMQQVGDGDYSARVVIKGQDEMARLSDSFNDMAMRVQTLIQDNYEAQISLQKAEVKALKAQTNPHFLYNCLNSIHMMALMDDTDVVLEMTQALSRYYRYRVSTETEVITIGEEVEQVKNYLAIQSLRFKDRLEVRYDIEPAVLEYPILKLILQPLVENAIVHGTEQRTGKGVLILQIHQRQERICIRVMDNGPGPGGSKSTGEGTGMSNTERRLHYHYGEDFHFALTRADEMTVVELDIPAERGSGDVVSSDC